MELPADNLAAGKDVSPRREWLLVYRLLLWTLASSASVALLWEQTPLLVVLHLSHSDLGAFVILGVLAFFLSLPTWFYGRSLHWFRQRAGRRLATWGVLYLLGWILAIRAGVLLSPDPYTEDFDLSRTVYEGDLQFDITLLAPLSEVLTAWSRRVSRDNARFPVPTFPSDAELLERERQFDELIHNTLLQPKQLRVSLVVEPKKEVAAKPIARTQPPEVLWVVPDTFYRAVELDDTAAGEGWRPPVEVDTWGDTVITNNGLAASYALATFEFHQPPWAPALSPLRVRLTVTPTGHPLEVAFPLPVNLEEEATKNRAKRIREDEEIRRGFVPSTRVVPHGPDPGGAAAGESGSEPSVSREVVPARVRDAVRDHDVAWFPPRPRAEPLTTRAPHGGWVRLLDTLTVLVYVVVGTPAVVAVTLAAGSLWGAIVDGVTRCLGRVLHRITVSARTAWARVVGLFRTACTKPVWKRILLSAGTGAVAGAAVGQTPEEKALLAVVGTVLGAAASRLLKPFLPTNKIVKLKAGIVLVLAGAALPWLALASETYYPQLGVLGNMLRSPSAFVSGVVCVAVGILVLLFATVEPWRSVPVRLGIFFSVGGATLPLIYLPLGSPYVPRLGIMWLLLENGGVFAAGVLSLVAGLGLILFALADRLSRPQTRK